MWPEQGSEYAFEKQLKTGANMDTRWLNEGKNKYLMIVCRTWNKVSSFKSRNIKFLFIVRLIITEFYCILEAEETDNFLCQS